MTSEAFYSQLGRAVADAPDKVFGRAEQVKSWIQANASKLGVKQDEIVWSGVLDWLDLQEGKVSKEQVLGYLDANGVQVEEVMFGELSDNDFISKFKEYGYGIEFEIEGSDKSAFYKNNIGEAVEYSKLPKVLQDYMNRDYSSKYDQKSVPGGSSYKELLLTLPSEPKESLEAYIVRHKDFYKGMDVSDAIIENDWLSNRKIGHEGGSGLYKSTHFATPNILAHVRFDERVNNEGGKTLFIQEIQSDWGQDGKKRGFIERYNPQDVAVLDPGSIEANQPEIFWYFKVPGNVLQIPKSKYTTESEALNYILNEKQTISAASTPLGPFVTETRAWVGLAIKRITRYAAENGFERVAFINGVQAADLFDLSKQVDSVTVAIDGGSPTGKVYRIITMKDGVKQGEWRSLEMDEMPNIIGKDLSEKGIKEGGGTYSGLDLQVGSEGMKVFYNQIVPQVVKGVIKNLGGELSTFINEAKAVIRLSQSEAETLYSEGGGVYYKNIDDDELAVSDDDIEEGDEFFDGYDNFYTYSVFEKQTSQLSFNVTDQMRTKILNEGLPLFSQDIGNYSQGLSIDLIDAEIARFKSEWTAMPDVIVVQSVDSLPFEAPVNADGAYYDGRVYVVANNIVDIKQLQKVMAHECVLHHSLQEMLGDYGFSKLHAGIQGLKAAGDPTVVALAANILGRYGVLPPEVETKEIIARAGELCLDDAGNVRIGYGFMKSVYAGVAGWLRDQGFKVAFTNVELQGIMHDAGEWIKRDVGREFAGSLAPVMSLDGGARVKENMLGWLSDNAQDAALVDKEGYNKHHEKDLLERILPNKSTRTGDSKVTNDASTKTIHQASEGDALDTIAPSAEYYVNTFIGVSTSKKLGASKVLSSEHLAQATYYLNKSAVERMDGLVTDKDGNPLAVIGGFKGATTQSAVYPATLMAEAVRIPNAANLWLSHNHPSGKAELSRSDVALYANIKNVFDGSGIEVRGLIAVAKDEYASIDIEGESNFQPIPTSNTASIVPVIERELQDDGVRHGVLSSPAAAKAIAFAFHAKANQDGIILNDAQNRVIAWLPLSDALSGQLKNTGGLNGLYRAISQSNAVSAIISHDGSLAKPVFENGQSAIENIGKALKNIDVSLLDAINVKDKSSHAERGDSLVGKVLFSRNESTFHGSLAGDISISSTPFKSISIGLGERSDRTTVEAHDASGKEVAHLSLYRSDKGLELATIDVKKEFRRQGIGRALVEIALRVAGDEPVYTTLHTPYGKKLFSSFGLDKPGVIKSALDVVLSGSFSGRVMDVVKGVVVQKIGRDPDKVVRHDVMRLSGAVKVGDVVDIKYKNERASVIHKKQEISR